MLTIAGPGSALAFGRAVADRTEAYTPLACCEFQAPQKCLRLIKVYTINFML